MSDDLTDFDGVADLLRAWGNGLRPDPDLTVSQWADRHRMLSGRASAEPGRYRTVRTPYMREIMDALSPGAAVQRIVFMKAAQVGAPLALDTAVPTPFGWTTMGGIAEGDLLYDERGRICRVTGLSPVFEDRPCFEVAFDDGERIVADGDHRWAVWDFTNDRPAARTLTTAEMAGRVTIGAAGKRRRYAIDCCDPVDMPDQDLILHPYVLGLWLGDGSSIMNHISVHEEDAEVVEHLRACGVEAEFRLPHWRKGRIANVVIDPTFRMRREDGASLSDCFKSRFVMRLRMLDVLDNKHIPLQYMRASRRQRLELVRGLMDSDGTISPDGKRCEFSNADRGLIDAMVELLRGLGYKPAVYHGKARRKVFGLDGRICESAEYWRISWTAYAEEPMFRLSRKRARMRSVENGRPWKSRRRRIVTIRPTPSVPVRCVKVDSPNHLFLCGKGWIPTHNTEAGNNWIGFAIHQAPGPMLAVQPTVELAKRNSRQRIDPLIDESPELRERVKPARSRDAGNTMLSKEFAGGILIMTGANSAVGLRSTPARYIFLDEVDAYPGSADEEGDPVTLAEARSLTFAHRRKVFLVSTPTIRGLSRIEREYEASDQRRYFVPCPHCGAMQWLKFERLRWQKGRPETAAYTCEGCDAAIAEHHKTAMLEGGEWRATATAADPTTVGYHLSALYSPVGWLSWPRIARNWEAAQGSDEAIKAFRNTILGETWVETGEAPDWQRLYDRRERWTSGTVPAGGLFLTAGADVQKDRIEIDVWAWGRGLESWLVDHVVIEGGPDRHDAWSELTALLDRSWPHERGAHLRIARLAIDTGYEAPAVYSWSRAQGFAQVSPVKGVEGFNRSSPVSGPTFVDATEGGKRLRRGARLWTVAVSTFKAETYRHLRLERPTDEARAGGARFPAGTIHLPAWADSEWCKQFVAEQLVTVKTRRGFARLEWQKLRERNEALDCRVYARAAAWIAGADRWGEEKWRDLERQVGSFDPRDTAAPETADSHPGTPEIASAGLVRRAPARRGRRVFTPSYLS
ncbi:MAG: terminase [Alphaproteobacteria bacterium HGW-Alphaproteobacteria-3]|nr:MAG: terminase [Alphaproteobacteria bacterium HGW-Alphaproteobacteria-3]